jgi:HSP20 family protein
MPRDLVELMHALFWPAAHACRDTCWSPALDIYRTRTGWLMKLDLAGVRPGDLSISVRGPQLIVRGRRRDCCVEAGLSHHRMEIAYGPFERVVELPCDLNRCALATNYSDGILLIDIQNEEAKS